MAVSVHDSADQARKPIITAEVTAKAQAVVADPKIPLHDEQQITAQILRGDRLLRSDIGDMRRAGCTKTQVADLVVHYGLSKKAVAKIVDDLDSYGEWSE